jgi:hypothetical protein
MHFEELAVTRRRGGLSAGPSTPEFLVACSARAAVERADRLSNADDRVRQIARRAMREERKP